MIQFSVWFFPNFTLAMSDNNMLMNIDMLLHNVGYLDVAALWLDLFISSDGQSPHCDHKKRKHVDLRCLYLNETWPI